mgnify:CR=1 FL=1
MVFHPAATRDEYKFGVIKRLQKIMKTQGKRREEEMCMKKNKMRGTFCCVAMKVAIAFYKTYVILFYYEVLKHYGISPKRVLGNP